MDNELEHSNLIRPEVEGMQEERMEKSLRPQTLDEYIGQTKVKENMRIYKEENLLTTAYFMDHQGLEKLQLQI